MEMYIVEDSALMRGHLIETLCGIKGIKILGVSGTSKQAVEFLSKRYPEIMTIDISLQEGTGLDVLKFIKQRNPDTITVVLTNYAYPQYRDLCSKLGADFFFDKTKEYNDFVNAIVELQKTFEEKGTHAVQVKDSL